MPKFKKCDGHIHKLFGGQCFRDPFVHSNKGKAIKKIMLKNKHDR